MELDRPGGQFKLTIFSRPLEASQCKTRLKTLRWIGRCECAVFGSAPVICWNPIGFGTLHQFLAEAMPSDRRSHGKRPHVQPSGPNISEPPQHLAIFVSE